MDKYIENFRQSQTLLLQKTQNKYKRFLFDKINFKERLIGIAGTRGVGKTTLILQYLNEYRKKNSDFLYFSADNVLLKKGDLYNLAENFYLKYGGRLICIDEIHRFENWNQELKNIYDSFPDLKIIFSGSSTIDLIKGKYDLSRRAILYKLPGLSFREFLYFERGLEFKSIKLDDLFSNYKKISENLSKETKILMYFNEYLEKGYYPFYKENEEKQFYFQKILSILDKMIYEDIASFYKLKTENLIIFKQILHFFTQIEPGELNAHRLCSNLQKNHETISHYLEILNEIDIINYLSSDKYGYAYLRNAKKVYLNNPNLYHALAFITGKTAKTGMLRELFLINQLYNADYIPLYTEKADILIKNYILEIGGKNKDFKQIANLKNSFLVQDDILIAGNKKIPLYLFGFLY
jgi:hypothetical protein